MITEKREKQILKMSFFAGLAFAVAELIFAVYSHSQSALTDAVYDASELVFIALLLFLTPLFHNPVSEKHPYGYYQVESIFVIIKGAMMLSVTLGVSAEIVESALSGGNPVDSTQIAVFQCGLGTASLLIYLWMRRRNRSLSSPTVEAELLGWRLDVFYSLGMALAFFLSRFLQNTPLAGIAPYFDQLVAVAVILFMLPEGVRVLSGAIRDIFLFSPDEKLTEEIKALCVPILSRYGFTPVFFDITRTGRHLWVAVYFQVSGEALPIADFRAALAETDAAVRGHTPECTCELILAPAGAATKAQN